MTKKKEITKKNKGKKKKSNKGNIIKIVFIAICLIIILVAVITSNKVKADKGVITIDGTQYTEADFNMFAFVVKSEYFGNNNVELTEDTLNTLVNNSGNQTIGEFLKEKTLAKIKIAASVQRIADNYEIKLSKSDMKEVNNSKKEFIKSVGGAKNYQKLLQLNETNDKSYDKIAKVEKLYQRVYDELYTDGMVEDLSEEEYNNAKSYYQNNFVKVKQIKLLKTESNGEKLKEALINQKETLLDVLVKEVNKKGANFDDYIIKYSEDYEDNVKSTYYDINDIEESLKNAILLLKTGDISGIVSDSEAYYIIVREDLDESQLKDYLDKLRSDKYLKDVSDNLDKIAIIYGDKLDEIKIK